MMRSDLPWRPFHTARATYAGATAGGVPGDERELAQAVRDATDALLAAVRERGRMGLTRSIEADRDAWERHRRSVLRRSVRK